MDLELLESRVSRRQQSPLFARLAEAYLEQGRILEAKNLCLTGVQKFPSYASGTIMLAKCYAAEGETERAATLLKTVQAAFPDAAGMPELLARLSAPRPVPLQSPLPDENVSSPTLEPATEIPQDVTPPDSGVAENLEPVRVGQENYEPVIEATVSPPEPSVLVAETTAVEPVALLPDEPSDSLVIASELSPPSDETSDQPPVVWVDEVPTPFPSPSFGELIAGIEKASFGSSEIPAPQADEYPPVSPEPIPMQEPEMLIPESAGGDEAPMTMFLPPATELGNVPLAPIADAHLLLPGETSALQEVASDSHDGGAGERAAVTVEVSKDEPPVELIAPPVWTAGGRETLSDSGQIVSRTLAEIYEAQGELGEALITYQLLLQRRPDLASQIEEKIGQLRTKIQAREAEQPPRK